MINERESPAVHLAHVCEIHGCPSFERIGCRLSTRFLVSFGNNPVSYRKLYVWLGG